MTDKVAPPALPAESTHRRLWRMAGPIILSNISVPVLGAVDTAVMGHLSEPYYIGAVALGTMIFNFIYHGFNCLRMGTTGPTAQARGAGQFAEVRALALRALLLGVAIGGIVILLQVPIVRFAFWAIDSSPDVEALGTRYFLIKIWSMPAVLGTYAIIGWQYGIGDARRPLVLLFVMNGLNVALDFLFVFGFGWDVGGVAAAALIASYVGLALGLWFVRGALGRLPQAMDEARVLDPARMRRMLTINLDIFLRTMCVVSAGAIFMAKSAALGDVALAANQVLYNFIFITSFGLDGIAFAAEAILGEAAGRRARESFRRDARTVLMWAGLVAMVNAGVYALAGGWIVDLMTSIPEVRAEARLFLVWAVFMPLIATWAYTYDGIFLAATRTRAMLHAMVFSLLVYLAALYSLIPLFGNHGLWIALAVFLGIRGIALFVLYPRLLRAL
jgi:MATE family multidrug resistance protein